ncbi:MAG: histidinol-phosphate transaminase [Gammaproteobacteria bacterium]|nr:histidinol-phosphate transaminase [Gammaproteobacteria bacterium]
MQQLIEHWIRPEIRGLSAYQVADARGLIKLDAMENPYPWPAALKSEWAELLSQVPVNRYPDPQASALRPSLRAAMGLAPDMELLLGNGSDEIIQMLCLALAGPGRVVLSVDPGFVMYRMIASFCGMRYVGVPLKADDFSLDLQALLQALEQEQPALVFLAYPNNPTGNLFDQQALVEIIQAAPGLVVIDEAYAPFTDASFIGRLGEFDNLLVMRTLSKMGLAGLRFGLLAGPRVWLEQFDKVRLPYNINSLTQISVDFALRHLPLFEQQTRQIRRDREDLYRDLAAIDGLHPYPSDANFILTRTPEDRAAAIFESMKRQGVLVKKLDGSHPLLKDCLRLTVGTPEENQACLKALTAALA